MQTPRKRRAGKDIAPGTMFGYLKVLQKVRTAPNSPGGQRYRLECTAPGCGNRITKPRFYLMRAQPLTHCGCQAPKADEPYTKRSWYSMHLRCYYEPHMAYKHYGGRGIEVCWRWHRDNPDGWKNFLEDMGPRPKNRSIDRIDPNGHYELYHRVTGELQCRWATAKTQANNQRRHHHKEDDDAES